jgi:hypothetical protein
MGILDGIDPATAGILSAAFQGLQSSGPSRMPQGLGQIIGQAGTAGLGTYGSTLEANRKNQQTQALIELERLKAALTQQQVIGSMRQMGLQDAVLQQLMGISPNPQANPPATVGGFNPSQPQGAPPQAQQQVPQGQPPIPQQTQGMFGSLDPNTRNAMALDIGLNKGANAATLYQHGTQPIPAREGGLYRTTPSGDIEMAPGFIQGEEKRRRMIADVANQNEIVQVKMPDGRMQRMTKAQELAMVQPHTVVGGAPAVQITGPTTTGEAEQGARGAALASLEKEIDSKAEMASMLKSRVSTMRTSLAGIDPNNLAGAKQKLGEWLQTLGVEPTKVEKLVGSPGDYQAIQKQAIAMAFEQVRQLSARPAVQEVIFAMKSNPNLEMQPQGLVKIMNAMEGLSNYQIAMSGAKEKWKQSHMGSMEGFIPSWTANHPVSEFVDLKELRTKSAIYTPTKAGPVTMRPVGALPPEIEDLVKKYGNPR